jgi:DnaJ-class molecular chaperone
MKRLSFILLPLLLVVIAPALASNDQCLMCHRAMAETPVRAHQNCMTCHGDGAEEHMANIRVPPEPVEDETCAMCHRPNVAFLAISAHNQGLECAACHLIHDK